MGLGEARSWFDSHVIDGAVNAAGGSTRHCKLPSWWDKWIIDGIGVNGPAILARMLSLSRPSVRVGTGAVVRAGHGGGTGWVCFYYV